MKLFRNVSVLPYDGQDGFSAESSESDDADSYPLAEPVRHAIARTRAWLLSRQRRDDHWVAELEGDSILESETVLLLAFLGREDSSLAKRAAQRLVQSQLPQGGWAMYPGGEVEISGSVKAYFALKLTGHDPSAEYMQRARSAILAHGGADAVNSFTRFYLAILGQIPFEQCPEVPPEAVLLPKWLPVSLYAVSAWSRTIIV
ncbi:MAG: squalene--hopene cyclase, partial [Planctomycetes bacterium]|nr:squalene--hopene cyclase [Planctomycetota bacterium]